MFIWKKYIIIQGHMKSIWCLILKFGCIIFLVHLKNKNLKPSNSNFNNSFWVYIFFGCWFSRILLILLFCQDGLSVTCGHYKRNSTELPMPLIHQTQTVGYIYIYWKELILNICLGVLFHSDFGKHFFFGKIFFLVCACVQLSIKDLHRKKNSQSSLCFSILVS